MSTHVRMLSDGTKCYTKNCSRHTRPGKMSPEGRSAIIFWMMEGSLNVTSQEVAAKYFHKPKNTSTKTLDRLFEEMTDEQIEKVFMKLSQKKRWDNMKEARVAFGV